MKQIFGQDRDAIGNKILIFKPFTMDQQTEALKKVNKLVGNTGVGLIIVDSMTIFYRKHYGENSRKSKKARSDLAKMMVDSLSLARENKIPFIITNQVYTNIDTNTIRPIGGHVIDHNAKCIVHIEKKGNNLRKAILVKHRSRKTGSEAYFKIVEEGLVAFELFEDVKEYGERDMCVDNGTAWVREESR